MRLESCRDDEPAIPLLRIERWSNSCSFSHFFPRSTDSDAGVTDLVTRWNRRTNARSTIYSSAAQRIWRIQRSRIPLSPLDRATAEGILHVHDPRCRVASHGAVPHVDSVGIAARSRGKSCEARVVQSGLQSGNARRSSAKTTRRGGDVVALSMVHFRLRISFSCSR